TRSDRDWSSDVCSSDLVPDAKLLFFDNVVVFDHVRQKMLVIANLFTADPKASIDGANARIDRAIEKLRHAAVELLEFPAAADAEIGRASCRERGQGWVG